MRSTLIIATFAIAALAAPAAQPWHRPSDSRSVESGLGSDAKREVEARYPEPTPFGRNANPRDVNDEEDVEDLVARFGRGSNPKRDVAARFSRGRNQKREADPEPFGRGSNPKREADPEPFGRGSNPKREADPEPFGRGSNPKREADPEPFGRGSNPRAVEEEEEFEDLEARFGRGSNPKREAKPEYVRSAEKRSYWASGLVEALKARGFNSAALLNARQPN